MKTPPHVLAMLRDRSGATAMIFAAALPVLLLFTGGAIDFAALMLQRQQLQAIVDEATLTAARELSLSDSSRENVIAVVETKVKASSALNTSSRWLEPTLETRVSLEPMRVEVAARQPATLFFDRASRFFPSEVTVNAAAQIVGKPNICVLALEDREPGAIWLVKNAKLTGQNCAVFSNSSSGSGITVRDNATLTAQNVCSSGGVDQDGVISPAPILDCPTFTDPLASRPEPTVGACEHDRTIIEDKTITLRPGVYCEGLIIRGSSKVTLEPGVYTIKDAAFILSGNASIAGDGVTIYLHDRSFLFFGHSTAVRLTASKTGPQAGLLIFGSRAQPELFTHTILSKDAHTLVGTIYLPKNSFVIDGEAGVGSESAYTAIVTRRLVLLNGPHLVLNTNYDMTDVPVPVGIRGATVPASLIK